MLRLTMILLALTLLTVATFAQTSKRPANTKQVMKTIRLHIDGFQKSKSGAI